MGGTQLWERVPSGGRFRMCREERTTSVGSHAEEGLVEKGEGLGPCRGPHVLLSCANSRTGSDECPSVV